MTELAEKVIRPLHQVAVLVLLLGTGCTAGWANVVRYSDRPAPAEQTLPAGVYAAILRAYISTAHPSIVVAASAPDTGELTSVPLGTTGIPGHWADTIKVEVRAAMLDTALRQPAAIGEVQAVGRALAIHLVPPDSAVWQPGSKVPPIGRLHLSNIGFNRDSTIAAIRVSFWCGPVCGVGETMLLARKPGAEWRIWFSILAWIS